MIAAQLVHTVHWIFLLFVLTGWLLPWPAALAAHLLMIPGLILHWRTNNNRCVLTEIEERLRPKVDRESVVEEGQFIKGAWAKAYGQEPTDELLSRVIYGTMVFVWLLSLAHLLMTSRVLRTY
jgi:hypothetical protein